MLKLVANPNQADSSSSSGSPSKGPSTSGSVRYKRTNDGGRYVLGVANRATSLDFAMPRWRRRTWGKELVYMPNRLRLNSIALPTLLRR